MGSPKENEQTARQTTDNFMFGGKSKQHVSPHLQRQTFRKVFLEEYFAAAYESFCIILL